MATVTDKNKNGSVVPAPLAKTPVGQQASTPAPLAKPPVPAPTKVVAPKPLPTPASKGVLAPPTPATSKVTATTNAPAGVSAPPTASVPPPPKPAAPTFNTPQYQDWQAKQSEHFANLEKIIGSKFEYDPESDPAYQAQRQLAQLRAGDATKNALETANDKGILGSSMNISQLGQIQQRAEQEAAAYIPEYRQQAYGQYQDSVSNASNLLNAARGLRGDQFNEAVTEGQLTGNYLPSGAKELMNNLYALKQQAETRGITAEDRAGLSGQADAIRSQLQNMGVDISRLGADTSLANARGNAPIGTRTLAGQDQDYRQQADQRDFNEGVRQSDRNFNYGVERDKIGDQRYDKEFEYTQGRDKVKDQQWQDEFDRIKEQSGLDNALRWASQSLNEREFNDRSAQSWAGLDWDMQQGAGGKAPGSTFTPNQVYGAIEQRFPQFFKPSEDMKGNPVAPTKPSASDLEAMYQAVIGYGLSEAQENDVLRSIGMTDKQIADFDSKYLSASGKGNGSYKQLGGVLSGTGDLFAKYGKQYGVDPALLAAIAMHETGNGTSSAAKNKNNVGGMMRSKGGLQEFGSIEEGIAAMASNLRRLYLDQGLTTIEQIQRKYAPVGAANDPTGLNKNWVNGVSKYYQQLTG
ncbi:glucosaminidase domain-containing protein [Paenibacillus gorillae]|uniref:glucosaminidase domain-containing protein n=1 Tax=Paenibacillus gorillae TaxID=1243662 RepID=UPI0004B08928|nr:glucosaminidase domain-containing protein [Paenibacillus gorillae]